MQNTISNTIGDITKFYEGREGVEIAEGAIKNLQEKENIGDVSTGAGEMDWRGRNGGVRTLGIGISDEFINKGFIDLRGRKVESPEQLAILSQVFRDPRYETLRFFYMKDRSFNNKY